MRRRELLFPVLLALAGLLAGPAPVPAEGAGTAGGAEEGGEATVAVASNFLPTARRLAEAFAAQTGHRLRLANGATGTLHAQIVKGAPFDVFLSADRARVDDLERAGLLAPGKRMTYAVGRLVLYLRDPALGGDTLEETLRRGALARIAMADPALAPYGRAAGEALRALGLEEALRARLVRGHNIAQAFAFVQSGNADAGFVALSLAQGEGGARIWVPEDLHAPILQDAALLRRGAENPAARAFFAWLGTPRAREIIRAAGYGVVP